MIDFAGPWEVFQDVMITSRGGPMENMHVFDLYTVSDSRNPIHASGGMQIVPDYTFADAPRPNVVVIPAEGPDSARMVDWLHTMVSQSDVIMSVCNGAFNLAETGLLNGKKATSHHSAYTRFQKQFPEVIVQRNMRYVQADPEIFTAGGLSSGIDLALHIVELYFGRAAAEDTALAMEYEGQGWKGNGSASVKYSEVRMHDADSKSELKSGPNPSDQYHSGVLGNWQGMITIPAGSFRVAVHIWPDSNGKLIGTIDSLDEGTNGMTMDPISFTKPDLHFQVRMVGGSFEGKINADQSAIAGSWNQGGKSVPLKLERASK